MIFLPMPPLRNQNITNVYAKKILSDEQCERIIASANSEAWRVGEVGGQGGAGRPGQAQAVRRVNEQFLPLAQDGFPLSQIIGEVDRLNATGWGFDLAGIVRDDMPYLMRYDSGNQDFYDWHIDVGYNINASRKIGFSVQLTAPDAYDGGELEFMKVDLPSGAVRERGTLVAFPAFRVHRVQPVTRGTRHVIVGWVHGDAFR